MRELRPKQGGWPQWPSFDIGPILGSDDQHKSSSGPDCRNEHEYIYIYIYIYTHTHTCLRVVPEVTLFTKPGCTLCDKARIIFCNNNNNHNTHNSDDHTNATTTTTAAATTTTTTTTTNDHDSNKDNYHTTSDNNHYNTATTSRDEALEVLGASPQPFELRVVNIEAPTVTLIMMRLVTDSYIL